MEKSTKIGDVTSGINLVKRESPGVFRMVDIVTKLNTLGVTLYGQIPYSMISLGYIIQAGATRQDGYTWKNSEPIYISTVQVIVDHARKVIRAASNRASKKRKGIIESPIVKETQEVEEVIPVQERKELVPLDKAIYNAIKLLSENGYRISKPVFVYEEVTIKAR